MDATKKQAHSRQTSGSELLSAALGFAAGGVLVLPAVVVGGAIVQAALPLLGVGAAVAFLTGVRHGPPGAQTVRPAQD